MSGRAQGHSKLVYNKATRTIDKIDPHPLDAERVERLAQVIRELCKWATANPNDWLISEAIAELKLWYRHLDDTRKMDLDQ